MGSALTPDFELLIAQLASALRAKQLRFMLIGGQAVLLHGEPRLTQDIDITLAATPDRLDDLLALCDRLDMRPLPENVERFVHETFVLPVAAADTSMRVDFIFSSTPYEAQAIERAVIVTLHDTPVPFASAEDLILHKLFAGRPRDIEDAAGVVRRKGTELDWEYMQRWAREFGAVPGREQLPDLLDVLAREPT